MKQRLQTRAAEEGRADDQRDDIIEARIEAFQSQTIETLWRLMQLVPEKLFTVDGEGSVHEVHERLKQAVKPFIEKDTKS